MEGSRTCWEGGREGGKATIRLINMHRNRETAKLGEWLTKIEPWILYQYGKANNMVQMEWRLKVR